MFSQHITKFTGLALVVAAAAAPVAAGRPVRYTPPTRIHSLPAETPAAKHQLATHLAPPATYSRQDKQLVPSSPTKAPAPAAPTVVSSSTTSNGFDWGDAAIGAGGGIVLSIVAIGGALGIQRSRKATIRTSAPVAAS